MSDIVRMNSLQRRRKNKKRQALIPLLIIAILIVGGFIALVSIMKIQHVDVTGNTYYSDKQILQIVGIDENTTIIQVQLDKQVDLTEYPYVESMEISYTSFTGILIEVVEKDVVGYLPYAASGYVSIDKEGYVIDFVDEITDDILLIEGTVVEQFTLGEVVNLDPKLMQAFFMFSQGNVQYDLEIDRIIVNNGDLNHIVFFIEDIEIEFGSMDQFNEKMQKIQDFLPMIYEQDRRIFDVEHNTLK